MTYVFVVKDKFVISNDRRTLSDHSELTTDLSFSDLADMFVLMGSVPPYSL